MSLKVNLFIVAVIGSVLCQGAIVKRDNVGTTTEFSNFVTTGDSFINFINKLSKLNSVKTAVLSPPMEKTVSFRKENNGVDIVNYSHLVDLKQSPSNINKKNNSQNPDESSVVPKVAENVNIKYQSLKENSTRPNNDTGSLRVDKNDRITEKNDSETSKQLESRSKRKETVSSDLNSRSANKDETESHKIANTNGTVLKEYISGDVKSGILKAENKHEDLKKEDEEEVVSSAEELGNTANRVQKVLNAFHEVTEVLAEVPKQIWMLPLRFGLIPGLKRTQEPIPELVPFPCSGVSKTHEPASSVHRLRPQDIKVVASLGDSITAANGAMAYSEEETRLNYRGVSAMGGGQGTWRKFLTLPNILKEFSPKLQGYALGAPDPTSPLAGYNLAENGALDDALIKQARDLVSRIRRDPYINFTQDWKVVNILIGGNDICNEFCFVEGEKDSPDGHRRMLEATLTYLKAKLPRTFVNLIHIPNILQLRNLKNVPFVCYAKQLVLCSCLFGGVEKAKAQSVERILHGYWEVEKNISAMSKFDSDEFTVVLQPFFLGVESPDNLNTIFGEAPDLNLFAPDCFHFSQRSHALIANALWNNMWEPVGNKTRGWEPIMKRFLCPTEEAPFFFTRRNSQAFLEQGRQ